MYLFKSPDANIYTKIRSNTSLYVFVDACTTQTRLCKNTQTHIYRDVQIQTNTHHTQTKATIHTNVPEQIRICSNWLGMFARCSYVCEFVCLYLKNMDVLFVS